MNDTKPKTRRFIHFRKDRRYDAGVLQVGRTGIPLFLIYIAYGVLIFMTFIIGGMTGLALLRLTFVILLGLGVLFGLIALVRVIARAVVYHIRRASDV